MQSSIEGAASAEIRQLPKQPKTDGIFDSVQGLRALAAFIVLIGHINYFLGNALEVKIFGEVVRSATVGVDIFFCISGFIMFVTAERSFGKEGAVARFWLRRALRIYPVLWVVTVLVICVSIWIPTVLEGQQVTLRSVLMSFLLLPREQTPLVGGHGWTLVHEIRFYAIFGMLLIFGRINGFRMLIGWAALSFVVLVLSYLQSPILSSGLPARVFNYVAHPNTIEFLSGVLIGYVAKARKTSALIDWLVFTTGVVSLLTAMRMEEQIKLPTKYWAMTLYALPAFLLVFGCVLLERRYRPRLPRWLVVAGDASYSTYLIHMVLIQIVGHFLHSYGLKTGSYWIALAILFAIQATGIGFFFAVERPLMSAGKKLFESVFAKSSPGNLAAST